MTGEASLGLEISTVIPTCDQAEMEGVRKGRDVVLACSPGDPGREV